VARRRKGRPIDGVLVVDKPPGISSNDVVQQAKRLFNAQKVGHCGSLDPLATGVLPLCFGEATKFSQFLLDADKKYWTRIKLGTTTETGDADGEILQERDASGIEASDIEAALEQFRGEIEQVPSMYSALKHNGQPLYKLARQGIVVERPARRVTIYSLELTAVDGCEIELQVHCTKGTYIRSLAEDLGAVLWLWWTRSSLTSVSRWAIHGVPIVDLGSSAGHGRRSQRRQFVADFKRRMRLACGAARGQYGLLHIKGPAGAGWQCASQWLGADFRIG
jgi:tRNA pseudouridine(55) synthase